MGFFFTTIILKNIIHKTENELFLSCGHQTHFRDSAGKNNGEARKKCKSKSRIKGAWVPRLNEIKFPLNFYVLLATKISLF